MSIRAIATALNRSPSTISREVQRNRGRRYYKAVDANNRANRMAKRPKPCLLDQNLPLRELVLEKLEMKWSPEQISGWLRRTKPRQKTLRISPETIYKTLYFRSREALHHLNVQHLRRSHSLRHGRRHTRKGERGTINIVNGTPIVAMEACASAHYWGRLCTSLGHEARLISPQFVKPFVKSNKNDRNDARAICEAALRPDMNFVPVKTVEQQAVLSLHRVREMLIGQRTATINQFRGLLTEFGLPAPTGRRALFSMIPAIIEDLRKISPAFLITCISQQWEHLRQLEQHINEVTHQIEMHARQSDIARRLQTIPGIGPITASALDAYVGKATQFRTGRQLAAWLGLVPRQHSTGGKSVLLGTSKRGNSYLRQLFVHGARAVVSVVCRSPDVSKQDKTITGWLTRKHMNVAVVAMANRNARIAWAVIAHERNVDNNYREQLTNQLLPG